MSIINYKFLRFKLIKPLILLLIFRLLWNKYF